MAPGSSREIELPSWLSLTREYDGDDEATVAALVTLLERYPPGWADAEQVTETSDEERVAGVSYTRRQVMAAVERHARMALHQDVRRVVRRSGTSARVGGRFGLVARIVRHRMVAIERATRRHFLRKNADCVPTVIREMEDAARGVLKGISRACRPAPLPPGEWVYVVRAGPSGPLKIGSSRNPSRRFSQLQTASATRLIALGVLAGGATREREIHRAIEKADPSSRLVGEWFRPWPGLLEYLQGEMLPWTP